MNEVRIPSEGLVKSRSVPVTAVPGQYAAVQLALPAFQILHSITSLNVGGAQHMLLRYIRALTNHNCSSAILALMTKGVLEPHARLLGADIYSAGMIQSRPSIAAIPKIKSATARARPDVIHGWMYHGNIAGSLGSRLTRRSPVVWSIHHSIDDLTNEKQLSRWLIRLSAFLSYSTFAISYCSATSARQHEKLGFDPSKTVVIPNGTDCDIFKPQSDARRRLGRMLGIPADRFIIGTIGRSHPMKDHCALVRALDRLLKDGLNVQGLLVGHGHEEGKAHELARQLGIAERISILGPRDDVADLTPGLDIFVLSSAWGEAFSLALAEAMACGVPSVTTDVGDNAYLLGDRDAVAPPGDVDALTQILKRLVLLEQDERKKLGVAARQRVVNNFSLRSYVDQHMKIYSAALSGKPSRSD